jgi:predicted kinase
MQQLILIRGLPGSGKSTYAKSLLKKGWKHFEADMYHTKKGVYDYQVSRAREAHEWCMNQTRKALGEGKSVIVSNTFSTYNELDPYIEIADERNEELMDNFTVEVKVIKCVGEFDSEHDVPDSVISRMADRWEDIEEEEVYDPLD